jgi:GNAT superfamily N-acetyltransferase
VRGVTVVGELELGWATDIAVLELSGSTVEDRGDHLVVRTPLNPTHHWGNCILVTDSDGVDDAQRWLHGFQSAFPFASWIAIGLIHMPGDVAAWVAHDLELELDEVLTTATLPRLTVPPEGYVVRRLVGGDWEQALALTIAQNDRTRRWERASYEPFARARVSANRALCERDIAAYFGAFTDGVLVASLGVVRCGTTARYQDVLTDAFHRRRGLATYLLGVTARWAAQRGCDRWVIVTEATNPAGRVYRNVGFELDSTNVQAYRRRLP